MNKTKIVVIGRTDLIGTRLVKTLQHLALCSGIAFGVLSSHDAAAQDSSAKQIKQTIVFDRPLPNVPGKSLKGVMVEYAPGASSPAHSHAKSAFIYATVLEGAIQSSVNG